MTNEAKILYILSTLNAAPRAGDENLKIEWLKRNFKSTYSKKVLTEIFIKEEKWKKKIDSMSAAKKKVELINLL